MKKLLSTLLILPIRFYQLAISPHFPPACRYTPTCSQYAMEAIRKRISEKPKEFLKLIRATEKATGLPITAELYKRPKECPDPRLVPYFAWKGQIACVRDEPVSEEIFGPDLGLRVKEFLDQLIPLYDFFNRFKV